MNKSLILLVLLFTFFHSNAQNIDSLDAKFGYKDIKFDMSADSVLKAKKAKTSSMLKTENYQFYSLPSEYRSFADFKCEAYALKANDLDSIYAFFLQLVSGSELNYQKLVLFFTNLYGKPSESDSIYNKQVWKGDRVELAVSYDSYPEKVTVVITNIQVRESMEAAIKQRLDNQKADF